MAGLGGGLEDAAGLPSAPDERTPRGDVAHGLHRLHVAVEEGRVDGIAHEERVYRVAALYEKPLARRGRGGVR